VTEFRQLHLCVSCKVIVQVFILKKHYFTDLGRFVENRRNSCEGEKEIISTVLHHITFLSLILIYVPPLLELFLSANNTLSYTARKRNLGKWLKYFLECGEFWNKLQVLGRGRKVKRRSKAVNSRNTVR